MAQRKPSAAPQPTAAWFVALAAFLNMFSVGAIYALSTLQVELPRLLHVPQSWTFAPFATACIGMSVGLGTCASSLKSVGAHSTVARGTAIWGIGLLGAGFFLAQNNFEGMLAGLAIGGIGVGWTYLAVIIMLGQRFPSQPLARSAIGPLGFSSGTAACLFMRFYLGFSSAGTSELGWILQLGGILSVLIGVVTMIGGPRNQGSGNTATPQSKSPAKSEDQMTFSVLLFFNALPGMTLFSALVPAASGYERDDAPSLPWTLAALTLGGLLAPFIHAKLQTRATFEALFWLRSVLLIVYAQFPGAQMGTVALMTVFFAHGTGFSVLPGVIKSKQSDPGQFPAAYGRVLIIWGFAGLVGSVINAVLVSGSGDMTTASLALGLVALQCAGALRLLPWLGKSALS